MAAHYAPSLKARIHIAKSRLDLDDDTYRDLLKAQTGKTSCAKMTVAELAKVMDRMRELGFRDQPAQRHGRKPRAGGDRQALVAKIEALLADKGRPWEYLTNVSPRPLGEGSGVRARQSMLERITGKQRLEFCTAADLGKIVAALTYDQNRRLGTSVRAQQPARGAASSVGHDGAVPNLPGNAEDA
jgi:phage gp16-like protein